MPQRSYYVVTDAMNEMTLVLRSDQGERYILAWTDLELCRKFINNKKLERALARPVTWQETLAMGSSFNLSGIVINYINGEEPCVIVSLALNAN